MFDKILVPVDFSEQSRAAFGHGALFAAAFGGTLELVHVVEPVVQAHPPFWVGESALAGELHRQGLARAELQLQSLLPTLPAPSGAAAGARVLAGTLPEALVDYARESKADLMVVSTHGRTGFSRWLMGSVSERLLRQAPCPVLVARGGSAAEHPAIRRLLVAVDLSEHSRRALSAAGQIAERFGAVLEVFYVWAAPYYGEGASPAGLFERIRASARAELDEFVARAALPAGVVLERTIVSGTPTAKINERLDEQAPDLLVLGTHGHGGFKRLVLGSVAEATARYASAATLVIP